MKKTNNRKKDYDLAKIYHTNTFFHKSIFSETAFNNYPNPTQERKHYVIREYPLTIENTIIDNVTLVNSIKRRFSTKSFNDESITFEEISNILHYGYGYLESGKSRRAVPSGGGRYPMYLYLAVFNIKGIEKGIYYYNATQNSLELLLMGDYSLEISNNTLSEELVSSSSCVIISVCSLQDTCSKYGNMGYKLLCMDLGHLSQNIYLLCSASNIKCRALLGFYNEYFNDLLNLNHVVESAFLLHTVGK